jgi:hypothetical protein
MDSSGCWETATSSDESVLPQQELGGAQPADNLGIGNLPDELQDTKSGIGGNADNSMQQNSESHVGGVSHNLMQLMMTYLMKNISISRV